MTRGAGAQGAPGTAGAGSYTALRAVPKHSLSLLPPLSRNVNPCCCCRKGQPTLRLLTRSFFLPCARSHMALHWAVCTVGWTGKQTRIKTCPSSGSVYRLGSSCSWMTTCANTMEGAGRKAKAAKARAVLRQRNSWTT